ncbi:valine--tRNA ligase [bacterium]|nr:valine--tRNA ligase [Candidatus Omnitrophota bacterium]MBU2529314.1 valine--tRNA ligase [bacterium]MBU3930542.1 valine--tRNA ligase [bacterium]MBU4123163.1 valine--tRNA ligase [bacterium]
MENKKASKYEPGFEEAIYRIWEDGKKFAGVPDGRKPFSIAIPPPNVTGRLHMGHALNNTLQDILIRAAKLRGRNVKWAPGTDHGGIATQNVVEKELAKEGKNRIDMGREEFLRRVNEWKQLYGGSILEQLKKLGCACDWDNIHFTMDETCSRAVTEAFVRLYGEGRIYRGHRLINYCVRCGTSLSDIEVEYKDETGKLWYIKYPVADEKGKWVVVATTRPETMLGDVAVAVNPKDERFRALAGKKLILPLSGREIPVVFDSMVEEGFGTGAVKVTPAHDFTDFDIGARHNLPTIKVIDEKGIMTPEAGAEFAGLNRYEARKKVCAMLEEEGLLEKIEDLKHSVSVCYRCGEAIEPMLSLQWFLEMKDLAAPAIKALDDGRVRFYPDHWKKPFLNFLSEIRDWCLSRQIWWGHRLPVYYCRDCQGRSSEAHAGVIVSSVKPEKCPVCGGADIFQDPDVLDTWFSSGMWPFEVFGWPEKTPELKYYYPTSVLVTGHEILYLWVARMLMMGIKFAGDIPFSDVYIHGIVRDRHGKKMSKSLGNTIDPLEITSKYGVDSLRYSLTKQAVLGHDLQACEENFIASRNFMNKISNAAVVVDRLRAESYADMKEAQSLPDRWIVSEFSAFVRSAEDALDSYDLARYTRIMWEFFWSSFCDWYLEILKLRGDGVSAGLVGRIFRELLIVMHPVIPFITEKIYGQIMTCDDPDSIMDCVWPEAAVSFPGAREDMNAIFELIQGVRNIRSRLAIPATVKVKIIVDTDEVFEKKLAEAEYFILPLTRAESMEFGPAPGTGAANFATPGLKCSVPVSELIDIKVEKETAAREIEKIEIHAAKLEALLANPNFISSASKEVVEQKKELLANFNSKKEKTAEFLASLDEG